MAYTVRITAVSGTLKKISGAYSGWKDSFADLVNNPNAAEIVPPLALPHNQTTMVLFATDGSFTLEFSADSEGTDGQGVSLEGVFGTVQSTGGTVYFVSGKHLKWDDRAVDAYGHSGRMAAGSEMVVGDGMVVCNRTGSFSLQIPGRAFYIFPIFANEQVDIIREEELGQKR